MVDFNENGLDDNYDPDVLDFDLFNNPLYKEPIKTSADLKQLFNLLKQVCPNENIAKNCLAQLCYESGWFKECYNYNFGNIKWGSKRDKPFTMYFCSEVYKGKEYFYKPPHIQCCFAAYDSAEHFVNTYTLLLKGGRYKNVFNTNTTQDFVHQLKLGGYFTASESVYLKTFNGVLKRMNGLLNK